MDPLSLSLLLGAGASIKVPGNSTTLTLTIGTAVDADEWVVTLDGKAAAGTYGNNAANLTMQGGQAIAAGQLGSGNTWNNALGAASSAYQNQNNFNEYMNRQRQSAYMPPVQDGGYFMGQGAAYGGQRAGL